MLKKILVAAVTSLIVSLTTDLASAGTTTPVDNAGRPCVPAPNGSSKQLEGTYGVFTQYKYLIENHCSKGVDIKITTNGGNSEYRTIGGNGNYEFICTDGYKGQRNCNGGILNIEVSWR